MPKHAIDYSKTVFYKIACKDVSVKDEYVGSTTDAVKRRANHKYNCNDKNCVKVNFALYVFIREHGGWDNWELVVIEEFPCKTSEQQRTRERYWLETLGATLNMVNPIRTHVDVVLEKKRNYVAHREHILEKATQYRATHTEAIREHQKEARERVQCECGSEVRRDVLCRHKKTAKHADAMAK